MLSAGILSTEYWLRLCAVVVCFAVPDLADMLMQVGYKVVDHRTRMAQQDTLMLQVFKKPFASGGCRMAFYAQDSNGVRSVAAVDVLYIVHALINAARTCLLNTCGQITKCVTCPTQQVLQQYRCCVS